MVTPLSTVARGAPNDSSGIGGASTDTPCHQPDYEAIFQRLAKQQKKPEPTAWHVGNPLLIYSSTVHLGKAMPGGLYPTSAVLGSRDIMLVVEPGTHGSSYDGNPLSCAVSTRALELVEEGGLVAHTDRLGRIFHDGVAAFRSLTGWAGEVQSRQHDGSSEAG